MNDGVVAKEGSTSSRFVRGVAWMLGGQATFQLIRRLFRILLASILLPADFGLMAMAMTVVSLSEIWLDLGFGRACAAFRSKGHRLVIRLLAQCWTRCRGVCCCTRGGGDGGVFVRGSKGCAGPAGVGIFLRDRCSREHILRLASSGRWTFACSACAGEWLRSPPGWRPLAWRWLGLAYGRSSVIT